MNSSTLEMLKRIDQEKMAAIFGGVIVDHVWKHGAASRAGLCEGDIVVTVNGMPTTDIASLVRARRMRRDSVSLELYRRGQRLAIEVRFSDSGRNEEGSEEPLKRVRSEPEQFVRR